MRVPAARLDGNGTPRDGNERHGRGEERRGQQHQVPRAEQRIERAHERRTGQPTERSSRHDGGKQSLAARDVEAVGGVRPELGDHRDAEHAYPYEVGKPYVDAGAPEQREHDEIDDEQHRDAAYQPRGRRAPKGNAVERHEQHQHEPDGRLRIALELGRAALEQERLAQRLQHVITDEQQEGVAEEPEHAAPLAGTQRDEGPEPTLEQRARHRRRRAGFAGPSWRVSQGGDCRCHVDSEAGEAPRFKRRLAATASVTGGRTG